MNDAVIGFIGVVVGAILSGGKDFIAAKLARKQNAEYLAIRAVVAMDQFIEGCASVVGDDGLSEGQRDGGGCLQVQTSIPVFHGSPFRGRLESFPYRAHVLHTELSQFSSNN